MKELDVNLSERDCTELFDISDVDKTGAGENVLDLKEFLVALVVGYVLELIPALKDTQVCEQNSTHQFFRLKRLTIGRIRKRYSTEKFQPQHPSGK